MSFAKRLLKHPVTIVLLSHLLALCIRCIYATCRRRLKFDPACQPYFNGEYPAMFAFWHGRLVMQPFVSPKGRPCYVLISRHADGRLISAIIERFGIHTVHGSSGKGVHAALSGFDAVAAAGGNMVVTPDGPRGPLQRAAPGAAYLAMQHNYPVIAMSFSATRHWRFKSWDRFMLPKPFATLVYVAQAPMHIATDRDIAEATQQIETALTQATHEADIACSVAP